jgi:hypothetical protein
MTDLLRLALEFRALTLLVIGLLAAGLALLGSNRVRHQARVAQVALRWFLVFSIGVGFFYSGVLNCFFSDAAQHGPGWPPGAFQFQLGMASLGFSAVGFVAAWGGLGMRLAALLGPAVSIYGTALGRAAGVAAGSPGSHLTDLVVPLIGFALLAWQYRAQSRRSVFARSRL